MQTVIGYAVVGYIGFLLGLAFGVKIVTAVDDDEARSARMRAMAEEAEANPEAMGSLHVSVPPDRISLVVRSLYRDQAHKQRGSGVPDRML